MSAVKTLHNPLCQIYILDCVDWIRSLPADSVDLIVTDPAYESLEKYRAIGTTTRLKVSNGSSNEWFPIFPNSRFDELFAACYRVLKKNAHLYMYCDKETLFIVKPSAERAGFKFWNILPWVKESIGMGYHYRSSCEYILFLEKGKRKINDLGMPNVLDLKEDRESFMLSCKRVANGYPTEKPVWVSEKLIQQSSSPGEVVCDPFMGSASVGEAALRNNRRFMGCDVSEKALGVAIARLAGCDVNGAHRD